MEEVDDVAPLSRQGNWSYSEAPILNRADSPLEPSGIGEEVLVVEDSAVNLVHCGHGGGVLEGHSTLFSEAACNYVSRKILRLPSKTQGAEMDFERDNTAHDPFRT